MRFWLRPTIVACLLSLLLVVQAQEETDPTPPPRPSPTLTLMDGDVVLERYFGALSQGQVGLLRLTGGNISEARALLRGREYPFLPTTAEDGWYALMIADIDAQPRDYPIAVIAQRDDGSIVEFGGLVTIEGAGFIRQNFDVPATLGYLIQPEVERNEFARLDALIAPVTGQALWGTRWQLPIDTPYSSAFGQYRILNRTIQTRHTGWDQTAPVGTPVSAMASGEVAYADQLDIRGNYVLLHHGWGVYSGYAHLSQINVQRGQSVQVGQIIGSSGNTGRSNGPHLHWEIAVNGEWVDGVSFIEMWLPS